MVYQTLYYLATTFDRLSKNHPMKKKYNDLQILNLTHKLIKIVGFSIPFSLFTAGQLLISK